MSNESTNAVFARHALLCNYEQLISYLDSKNFIFSFRSDGILSLEDERSIYSKVTTRDRMKMFFELVYSRIDLFCPFMKILSNVNKNIEIEIEECYKVSVFYILVKKI